MSITSMKTMFMISDISAGVSNLWKLIRTISGQLDLSLEEWAEKSLWANHYIYNVELSVYISLYGIATHRKIVSIK